MKIKIYLNGGKTYNINSTSSGNFNGHILANKDLKDRAIQRILQLNTSIYKYKGGKDYDGYNIQHVKQGSLGKDIDALIDLPDVKIIGDALKNKNRMYSSAFDPNGAELFYDVATLGLVPNPFKLANLLSNGDLKGAAGTTLLATSFGNGVGGALSRLLVGTHNLVGSNGVSKTYNLFKNGLYGLGIKSGIGDVLDGTMALDGGKYAENGVIKGVEYGTKKLLGRRAAIAAYNNIRPFGYEGHGNEMKNAIKQFLTPGKLNIVDKDLPTNINPVTEGALLRWRARLEIFKKYLGLGDADYFYKDTGKFDSNGYPIWTYNLLHIPEANILRHINQVSREHQMSPIEPEVIKDLITADDVFPGSGGNLMGTVKSSANGPVHVYDDIWDLYPLLNLPNSKFIPNKLMNKIRNFEVSSLIGDKPIHVINKIPIKPYNPEAAREWLDTFDLKVLLDKNKNLFYEWLRNTNFGK